MNEQTVWAHLAELLSDSGVAAQEVVVSPLDPIPKKGWVWG